MMTDSAQSLNRDGTAPMLPDRKAGHLVDLRHTLKLATWNVVTLSDTGYQAALVCELTRLNVSIAGITEARLPGNDCYTASIQPCCSTQAAASTRTESLW